MFRLKSFILLLEFRILELLLKKIVKFYAHARSPF